MPVSTKEISIGYVLNGGQFIGTPVMSFNYATSGTVTLPKAEKAGYIFGGWYDNPEFTGSALKTVSKKNITGYHLYAKWEKNPYTIRFAANGGTGKMTDYRVDDYDRVIELPKANEISFTRNGFEFVGWSLTSSGEIIEKLQYAPLKANEIKTLYAIWQPVKYGIKLTVPDGAKLSDTKQSWPSQVNPDNEFNGTYTVADTIKLPTLVRDGYKFVGWYNSQTNKKLTSISKSSINLEIEARFTPVTYSISYSLNKGTIAKGTVYDKSYSVETEDINLPVPSRAGYIFKGWYLDKALTKEVDSIETLVELNSYAKTTLYAKWEPISYTVRFINEDNESVLETVLVYDAKTGYKLDKNVFNEPGRVVSKFFYTDDAGKTKTLSASSSIKNLTAERETVEIRVSSWSNYKYSIKYVIPKGSSNGSKNPTSYYYSKDNYVVIKDAIKKGYEFIGWKDTVTGEYLEKGETAGTSLIKAGTYRDFVLEAVFTKDPTTYDVTYNLNGGNPTGMNPLKYNVNSPTFKLSAPVKEGYSFLGWYNTSTNKKVTSITKGSTGNLDLEARWKANKYTIKYNANGGKGKMSNTSAVYDSELVLRNNSFKRDGYEFLGWSLDKNATEATYKNAQTVSNLVPSGTVTLYAVWG